VGPLHAFFEHFLLRRRWDRLRPLGDAPGHGAGFCGPIPVPLAPNAVPLMFCLPFFQEFAHATIGFFQAAL
jgi:hypothetical protein